MYSPPNKSYYMCNGFKEIDCFLKSVTKKNKFNRLIRRKGH